MASSKITALSAIASLSDDDLIAVVDDPSGTPVTKKATMAQARTLIARIVQVVNTQTGAVTGSITTTIPFDDTIPQNTEGVEVMTLAITPTNASNSLQIDVDVFLTATNTPWLVAALFQDSTADALAAQAVFNNTSTAGGFVRIRHQMAAGTTSATTFKVRVGPSSSANMSFNGQNGFRIFGGVMASSITITEIRV